MNSGVTALEGRVWKLGDNVPLEDVMSAKYDELATTDRITEIVRHTLEHLVPNFADNVRPGDMIVTGTRFGIGKHHFGVIGALQEVGVSAVLSESLDPLFQRESIDRGLYALAFPGITSVVADGERMRLELLTGTGVNLSRELSFKLTPASRLLGTAPQQTCLHQLIDLARDR